MAGSRRPTGRYIAVLWACLHSHCAVAQGPFAPSPTELDAFRADLKSSFIIDDGGPGTSGGGPAMMRSLVRLGFHDCASTSCDGCIDVEAKTQNAGLDAMVEALTPICTSHGMGLADCFAAAASMAAEETSYEGATLVRMPLFFGRQDAPSCSGFTQQNPEATFPGGQDGFSPTFGYFKDVFGFTQRETVAIMGAHSLGRAEPQGSGFTGAWTIAPNALDNTFYKDMLKSSLGWEAEDVGTGPRTLWQWTSTTGNQMMLNSDMVLVKDVFAGSTKTKGEPTCSYADCPPSATLSIAEEYAADNVAFIQDFTAAFVKMLTKGYDVCELDVAPSSGSGPDFEELYGVSAIKQACGASALTLEAVGPTTSGFLSEGRTAAPPVATPAAPSEVAPAPAEGALPPPAGGPAAGSAAAVAPADGSSSSTTSFGSPTETDPAGVSTAQPAAPRALDGAAAQPVELESPAVAASATEGLHWRSVLPALCAAALCCAVQWLCM